MCININVLVSLMNSKEATIVKRVHMDTSDAPVTQIYTKSTQSVSYEKQNMKWSRRYLMII